MHNPDDLIRLFNHCFFEKYQTQLAYGQEEPLYLPADKHQQYNTIFFAHGFYSSALHECAHWMLAGAARRKLIDYGYWYEPDGRTAEQQKIFQQVEIKPQALEWIFAEATGYRFQLSFDNLNGAIDDYAQFQHGVMQQKQQYQKTGLPFRAKIFYEALKKYYAK